MALLLAAFAIGPASAETADADVQPAVVIDEIVVTVDRRGNNQSVEDLVRDPLVTRIQRELRELRIFQNEAAWRAEAARVGKQPQRLRLGYDPRDHLRAAVPLPAQSLPLDLMQPATLFRVGF